MEPRAYQSDASGTPPLYPTTSVIGFPRTSTTTLPATIPGPWWFYMIGEEVRNAIVKSGQTPDPYHTGQLLQALLNISGGI